MEHAYKSDRTTAEDRQADAADVHDDAWDPYLDEQDEPEAPLGEQATTFGGPAKTQADAFAALDGDATEGAHC
jgi:hypothetical protein